MTYKIQITRPCRLEIFGLLVCLAIPILKPLNAINRGIGGYRIQNVLWRRNNLPSSPFFQNAVILCDTNNIQRDSSEAVIDGILETALTLIRNYHHLDIIVCGLLPLDESWSVNRIYIKEINDYLFYKCD